MKRNGLKYLTPNERAALDELIARLRQKYRKRLVRVILFGSKVRGDFDAESDVDLMIVVKPNGDQGKQQIYAEEHAVADEFGVPLGAVVVEEDSFRIMQKARAPIYRNIRNEGYSLYPRVGKYSRVPLEVNGGIENVDENKKIQLQYFVTKAKASLDSAKIEVERGYIEGAANRAYYAVFYLATAVLFVLDVVRAKHLGLQSAFGEYFVKAGRVELEYADIFRKAYELRLEADYATEYKKLTPASAKQIVADAEKFVARMEQYLREVGAIE